MTVRVHNLDDSNGFSFPAKSVFVLKIDGQKVALQGGDLLSNITLDNLFSQMAQNDMKELAIVVKADVQGSAEAVKQSLEKISNDEVRVRVIHAGVGAISKSDVDLADASNAIIIGFNVRPDNVAKEEAAATKASISYFSQFLYSCPSTILMFKHKTSSNNILFISVCF